MTRMVQVAMAGDVTEAGGRAARAVRLADLADEIPIPTVVGMVCGNHALFDGRLTAAAAWYRRAAASASDPVEALMPRATELLALGYGGDGAASELGSAPPRDGAGVVAHDPEPAEAVDDAQHPRRAGADPERAGDVLESGLAAGTGGRSWAGVTSPAWCLPWNGWRSPPCPAGSSGARAVPTPPAKPAAPIAAPVPMWIHRNSVTAGTAARGSTPGSRGRRAATWSCTSHTMPGALRLML